LPTKRRAYTRGPDRQPGLDMLMVTLDFSDVKFSEVPADTGESVTRQRPEAGAEALYGLKRCPSDGHGQTVAW
jgi:hypothetical protein